MGSLQNRIHELEVGGGARYLRIANALLALVVLVVVYNIRAYRNMSTQEAMDSAQLARNIAEGHGYTTSFIRPYSMALLQARNQSARSVPALGESLPDYSHLKRPHPDISNPPVYPAILAGWMSVLPFHYEIPDGQFARYQPDFLIAVFNEALFLVLIVLVFFLARRLFDPAVAWLSAALILGTDSFWRFSVSGLSTILLMLILVGISWCLVLFFEEMQQPRGRWFRPYIFAGLAGLLVGLGTLTRYSFGWLIIPVGLALALPGGRQKLISTGLAVLLFLTLLGPWVARNVAVSGLPFGTSTYAAMEGAGYYPGHQLQRSLESDVKMAPPRAFFGKLLGNLMPVAQGDLLNLTGTWLTAFFLVGLLVTFAPGPVQSLRLFLVGSLVLLLLVQCLGRTQLSEDSPVVNSENLLVLVGPLVIIFGAALFYLLLGKVIFTAREMRYAAIAGFVLLASLPLMLSLLLKTGPGAFPPYHPPSIQKTAAYLKADELAMSDMPWAFAWYGDRKTIWLTPTPESFTEISDYQAPISMLFLSPITMNSAYATDLFNRREEWGGMALLSGAASRKFPLKQILPGQYPYFVTLTDWDRWRLSGEGPPTNSLPATP